VYLTILFFLSDSIARSANRPISQSTNQRKTKNKIQEEIASVISLAIILVKQGFTGQAEKDRFPFPWE